MKLHPSATRRLRRRLGARAVRTAEAALREASFDSLKIPFPPEAVVFPRRPADLAAVLELANRHRVPVTVAAGAPRSRAPRRPGAAAGWSTSPAGTSWRSTPRAAWRARRPA